VLDQFVGERMHFATELPGTRDHFPKVLESMTHGRCGAHRRGHEARLPHLIREQLDNHIAAKAP
jgi:hypothetical protein